jgi:hypothetical protein
MAAHSFQIAVRVIAGNLNGHARALHHGTRTPEGQQQRSYSPFQPLLIRLAQGVEQSSPRSDCASALPPISSGVISYLQSEHRQHYRRRKAEPDATSPNCGGTTVACTWEGRWPQSLHFRMLRSSSMRVLVLTALRLCTGVTSPSQRTSWMRHSGQRAPGRGCYDRPPLAQST